MMRGRLSLCSVGLMLLCLSLGSSLNEWDTASGKVFNEAYSPYEQCVLTLTPATYNVSATVFDQTKCVHLIDAFLLKLPKRCWLGGLHQPHDLGVCIGSRMTGAVLKEKKCVYLTDRQSMWKSWVGGKGDVDASQTRSEIPSGTLNHAVRYLEEAGSASDLLKVGVSNNFEVIAMAGDSMAVQLAQRLSCAALRANMTMQFYGNMFTVGQTGVSAVIDLSSVLPISASDPKLQPSGRLRGRTRLTTTNDDDEIKVKSVAISNYKYFQGIGKSDPKVVGRRKSLTIPEIDVACGPPDFNVTCRRKHAEDYIYKMAKKEFKGGTKWANTLHLLLLPVVVKFSWEFEPMAKAILELADTIHSINSRIVILSPFSQHFPSHPQGLYENFTSVKNLNETICQPHKIPYSENNKHIDTINFINAMNKIDKNWEQKIGFYEGFTSMSSSWHDLHPESRSTGFSVDCTHYIFQPLMFEEIWLSLSNYLKKDHPWIRSLAKPKKKNK